MRILSYSQVSQYERCPWSWYASKVLRYPQEPNATFAEGRAVHAALASHWLENRKWKEVLKTNLEREFKDIDPPALILGFVERKITKAHHIEDIYNRDEYLIDALIKQLRREFRCPLETIEVERKWEREGFVGRIDWRGKVNGIEYILDWKTSNKPYNTDRVNSDEQLTCYAALTGIRHVGFGVMPKEYGEVQVLLSARTQDECDAYWEKIDRIREEMDSRVYKPCEGWWCGWCSFQDKCPAKGDF